MIYLNNNLLVLIVVTVMFRFHLNGNGLYSTTPLYVWFSPCLSVKKDFIGTQQTTYPATLRLYAKRYPFLTDEWDESPSLK